MLQHVWSKKYDVAIVEVYSGRSFIWVELVSYSLKLLRKPFILSLHGGNLPSYARSQKHRVNRVLQSASAVTSPSNYLKHNLSPYRDDIIVLPNAIALSKYKFRQRNQIEPKLIWLRAFHKIYNPMLAVYVVASLRKEFPKIRLIMVGPDKHDGTLAKTIELSKQLGVSGIIEFKGAINKADIPPLLNQSDIFLNTSDIDNTPVSVIEAMASGLCIISTNAGGITYLLKHEEDSLVVNKNDSPAMAAALRRILSERATASQLSINARKKAESFDWSVVLPQWEILLAKASSKEL